MDKLAQSKRQTGRGFFNKLREQVNRPGAILEGIFKPELDRVMKSLGELDDRVRSEITGTKIGNAEEPAIKMSGKDLLKEARKAFNRREYMSGVSDLAMFHKKLQNMANDIDKFFVDVNKIHHKFLFQGVDEEKLKRLREHMEPKAASVIADQLLKEAGLIDEIVNIVSRRGRGLAAWEKKYPKETKALREGGSRLIDQAEATLESVISALKEMATARAIRRPDDYMDAAAKIKAAFNKFDSGDKGFRSFYQNAVMPWMKIKDEIEKQQQAQQPTVPTTTGPKPGQVELGGQPPTPPMPPPPPTTPGGTPAPVPAQSPPATPPSKPVLQLMPEEDEAAPDTEKTPPPPPEPPVKVRVAPSVNPPKVRVAHSSFYKSLEAMSNEDPRIVCAYVTKYAKSIQGDDPETAIKLFSIVKQIKG